MDNEGSPPLPLPEVDAAPQEPSSSGNTPSDAGAMPHAPQDQDLPEAATLPVSEPLLDAYAAPDAPQDSVFQDATEAPPAADPLSDELRAQIVRQVEYYFSDENLPTDKFLLKYVKKGKEGFVPIAVIASFRRMKRLVQDVSLIEAALRTSSQLVVSSDGKCVRRLNSLPDTEIDDSKPCTVLVENLPEDCSTESLQILFGNVGKITNITIRDPHTVGDSAVAKKVEMAISSKLHALVEYETVEAAEKAVATLNNDKNWRSGMRVELLLKRMGKYGLIQRGHKQNSEKNGDQASDNSADGQKLKSVGHHDEVAENDQGENFVGGKGGRKGRYRSRGRGHIQQNNEGQGHGFVPSTNSESMSKPIAGPRMPDGTRGFTMGRGKPTMKDGMNALQE